MPCTCFPLWHCCSGPGAACLCMLLATLVCSLCPKGHVTFWTLASCYSSESQLDSHRDLPLSGPPEQTLLECKLGCCPAKHLLHLGTQLRLLPPQPLQQIGAVLPITPVPRQGKASSQQASLPSCGQASPPHPCPKHTGLLPGFACLLAHSILTPSSPLPPNPNHTSPPTLARPGAPPSLLASHAYPPPQMSAAQGCLGWLVSRGPSGSG
jgi:hypothetical protein